MEGLKSSFLNTTPLTCQPWKHPYHPKLNSSSRISCSVSPDPWSLSDGNKPKPKSKHPKNPLSDDNARRIIKAKARYLSTLRRNQGSQALTPRWIKRSPEQMIQYLEDDRNGHLYGRHVVAAIQRVRSLSGLPEGSYDMRQVMASFVTTLTFREMCTVLKEQRSWRQARDFFAWMKLQVTAPLLRVVNQPNEHEQKLVVFVCCGNICVHDLFVNTYRMRFYVRVRLLRK
ncbi:hypothetical protein HanOQP8_Chr01g0033751 [Helianthus annuus]|nr:hypothetical protein HanLR1_Chr01g0033791 [Helianthus annuus]KAJ0793847.1 hypothetical protein HanOQP8_Chr01g0033751 [Helianthus annuus]